MLNRCGKTSDGGPESSGILLRYFQHRGGEAGALGDVLNRVTLTHQVTGLFKSPSASRVDMPHNDFTRRATLLGPGQTCATGQESTSV
jgi:hypothetical protein